VGPVVAQLPRIQDAVTAVAPQATRAAGCAGRITVGRTKIAFFAIGILNNFVAAACPCAGVDTAADEGFLAVHAALAVGTVGAGLQRNVLGTTGKTENSQQSRN
jgi:methyl coenzyme M reductase alpha subunit